MTVDCNKHTRNFTYLASMSVVSLRVVSFTRLHNCSFKTKQQINADATQRSFGRWQCVWKTKLMEQANASCTQSNCVLSLILSILCFKMTSISFAWKLMKQFQNSFVFQSVFLISKKISTLKWRIPAEKIECINCVVFNKLSHRIWIMVI